VEKRTIKIWSADVVLGGETTRVFYSLPDTFFEVDLFTCRECHAILAADRGRERHIGKTFESERAHLGCPQCQFSLADAPPYPQTYFTERGFEGSFTPPTRYPPDSELVPVEVWLVWD
jgi:hypothetical protein